MLEPMLSELNKDKALIEIVFDMGDLRKCDAPSFVKFLQDLRNIKTISMRCTKFSKELLNGICTAWKGNQIATGIDLYGTNLTTEHITMLSQSLSTSFVIQTLDLSGNILDLDAVKQLCSGFLKKTRSLSKLLLDGTSIDGESTKMICECLSQNASMRKLSMADILFGEDHAAGLIPLLKSKSEIEWLNLSGTFPNGESCKSIGKGLSENKHINHLIFDSCKMETDEFAQLVEGLGKHKELRILSVVDNSFDAVAGSHLGKILGISRSIEEINLKCNSLAIKGIESLMNSLKTNISLKRLNLRKNDIPIEGAKILADYLKGSSPFLEELDLSANPLQELGGIEIASSLKANKALRSLNLGDNAFADDFALAIGEMLSTNRTLEQLVLESNAITNKGVYSICQGLKEGTNIYLLNLENNAFSQLGAQAILKVMLEKTRIRIIISEVSHFVTSLG